jgi:hypothetical protein
MTSSNGLDDEMRHLRQLLGLEPEPLALDEGTAERLLAGQLHPADAPPEYRCAARVLAAAAAPPSPDELAGESEAVAGFHAVTRSSPHRATAPRRQPVPTRLLSLKLAAAVAIAALSVAGVASAATGTLPDAAQRLAHRMLGAPSPDDHGRGSGGRANGGQAADKRSTKSGHSPTGPDATGAAKAGLCRAWASGQGAANGGKADATAFQALTKAAGSADQIAAYCADVLKPPHEPQGQPKAPAGTGADHGQDQGNGRGQGAGQGQGQGNGGGQGSGQDNGHGTPPVTTEPRSHG